MPFRKNTQKLETPFGLAKVVDNSVMLPWKRSRGVLIHLTWDIQSPPDVRLVSDLSKNLDSIVEQGLLRIGVDNFPNHLKSVLPETIDLSDPAGDFSLSFYCPDDEDYLLGVVYRDWVAIDDWEGH